MYPNSIRTAGTLAPSLIYLAQVQSSLCRGRLKEAACFKARASRGAAPREGQRRRERQQGAAYRPPQSQCSTTVRPRRGPTGASPRGRCRAPQVQSLGPVPCGFPPLRARQGRPVTRPYALAVAACGEGRRPLEPWRNLGCCDMAVWLAPFGGHAPTPCPCRHVCLPSTSGVHAWPCRSNTGQAARRARRALPWTKGQVSEGVRVCTHFFGPRRTRVFWPTEIRS